jgi:hypothetical protein
MDSPKSPKGKKMGTRMKLTMLQTEKPELLDKKAAQMVELVRLQLIEKENRSAGALLDTRTLHKLDEAKVQIGKATKAKLDGQKRVESRRMGRAEEELKKSSEDAIQNMMSKGIPIVKTSNFENEELIWSTKSNDPNYSKKRRFDDPELQKFKNNLTADDRKLYKSLCHQALVDLATKYREEVEQVRSDMDLAGIFHPDANAHRAHCMYLMKLYNGIRADTIEDPVLRKIRSDIEEKKKKQEDDERRQRELIANYENKHTKKEKKSVEETLAQVKQEEEAQKKAQEDERQKAVEKLSLTALDGTSKPPRRHINKSQSTEKLSRNNAQPQLKKSLSSKALLNPSGATATLTATLKGAGNPKSKDESKHQQQEQLQQLSDQVSNSTESSETHAKSMAEAGMTDKNTKLFSKLKRGKLAGADPRSLLTNEALRLDEAEVHEVVRVKERSSIVDEKTSTWMLGLLQSSQIHKAAEGRALAPATQGLLPSDTFGGTIDSPMKASSFKEDPQRVIPFNEFYDMFKTFSEEGAGTDDAFRALAEHEKDSSKPQVPDEGWDPEGDDFGSKISLDDSNSVQHAEKKAAAHNFIMESFVPTDTVKDLAEVDPQFEAYMKMMRRQSPGGQKLFRGKVGKFAQRRPYNPLGQKAVHMTDSRGAATAESARGFKNTFKMSVAEAESSDDDDEPENKYMHTEQQDDDEKSQEYAADVNQASTENDKGDISKAGITGQATVTNAQLNISGRSTPGTPVRPGSRKSRSKAKQAIQSEVGMDMPSKLIAAFDCLQTSATSRLSYMRKYAMLDHATNFYKGIDRLAESAVLALAREQLVQRNIIKLREGYAVLPLVASNLMENFMEYVPPLLSSRAMALCTQKSFAEPLQDPASVTALLRIKRFVYELFPDDRKDDARDNAMTIETAEELLLELEMRIEDLLFKLRDKIADELDDQLQVQNLSLVEWLAKFKPKPVKEAERDAAAPMEGRKSIAESKSEKK